MRQTLGFMGMLICSAGLVALPAAARDREDYGSNVSHSYNQQYSADAPGYSRGNAGSDWEYGNRDNTNARRNEFRDGHSDRSRNRRDFRASRDFGRRRSDWR